MKNKKFVMESLLEFMNGGSEAYNELLVKNLDWLEDHLGNDIALNKMSEYIPEEELYWVGYGDPMDEVEEERVEKIQELADKMPVMEEGFPIEGDDFDGGDITVWKSGDLIVISWFDGSHDSNWFTNLAGIQQVA